MGMSNAERQRKFRLNRNKDPEKRQKFLEAGRKKYQKDKNEGKRKNIDSMTKREQRQQRRRWRKNKQSLRNRKEKVTAAVSACPTPPMSPDPREEVPGPSYQQHTSDKKRRREKAKCYRENQFLRKQLEAEKMKSELYKKRWQRKLERVDKNKDQDSILDTPRTKAKRMISTNSKKTIRKTLVFHNALIAQIRKSYRTSAKRKEKQNIAKTLSGNILRKYGFKCVAFRACGIRLRGQKMTFTSLSKRMLLQVQSFFERDDVSRIQPGLKQTLTSKKVKKQKRILCDSLINLHAKFLSENSPKLSYAVFCRLRPFWVVFPNNSDRSTCLCKLCENTQFMAKGLVKAKALDTENLDDVINTTVCYSQSKDCMYRTCKKCSDKRITFLTDHVDSVKWIQWRTKTEKRMIKVNKTMQEKDVTFTVKDTEEGRVAKLKDDFESQIDRFKKHSYNLRNQFRYCRDRKMSLEDNEVLLHVDFSENYVCKLGQEIHSMHFGASKKQLSLHTGVTYMKKSCKPQTFCTVSENLHHGPGGVWGHLKPVLQKIRDKHPEIDKLEIISDGPTAQYKQKGNFYLLSTEPFKMGYTSVVWNFLEAGHGKGVPDAVGGSVKRCADMQVKFGKDISCAQDFVNILNNSETDVFLIPDLIITQEMEKVNKTPLSSIPGTMKIHQVFSTSHGTISYRDISCTCPSDDVCNGHELCNANLLQNAEPRDVKIKAEGIKKTNVKNKVLPKLHETEETSQVSDKQDQFSKYLNELKQCKTIQKLKKVCECLSKQIEPLASPLPDISITTHILEVDTNSIDNIPSDVDHDESLYPCSVLANGNCLPSCGSVYAYGSMHCASELRVRILIELVMNEDYYLCNENLQRGLKQNVKHSLPKLYAQYSDMFLPGMHLTDKLTKDIFRLETLKVRLDKTFMGIWQIHSLATVLDTPIFSVYPQFGNPNVRRDLHRLIMPRQGQHTPFSSKPVHILWTSTRTDMNLRHWVPNHFVPIVPVSLEVVPDRAEVEKLNDTSETKVDEDTTAIKDHEETKMEVIEQIEKCQEAKVDKKETDETERDMATSKQNDKAEQVNAKMTEGDDAAMQPTKASEETVMESDIESETRSIVMKEENGRDNTRNGDKCCQISETGSENLFEVGKMDVPEPDKLISKYVIVIYDGIPYPGVVLDSGIDDVLVECMHKTSKVYANCFYWPKKLLDRCWYDHSNVLAVIPKPTQIPNSSHFEVDSDTWLYAVKFVNEKL